MKQFQVSTTATGKKRIVKVAVYDTILEFRRDCVRWDNQRGHEHDGYHNARGVCHKFERLRVYEDESEQSMPYVAYMRLIKGWLGTGVITHECTHAAVWIYQLDNKLEDLVDIEKEEVICYVVGDLSKSIVDKLYGYNLIQPEPALQNTGDKA